jgi:hypothetical protein
MQIALLLTLLSKLIDMRKRISYYKIAATLTLAAHVRHISLLDLVTKLNVLSNFRKGHRMGDQKFIISSTSVLRKAF